MVFWREATTFKEVKKMVTKQQCSAYIHCLFIISSKVQEMTGCHYRTETCRIMPFLSCVTSYRKESNYILHTLTKLNNCSKFEILGCLKVVT